MTDNINHAPHASLILRTRIDPTPPHERHSMLRILPAAFASFALLAGSVAATADDAPKAKGPVT